MASRTFYFSGTCKWAKVYKPDVKFDPQYNIIMYLDDDGWDTLKESGLGLKAKEDEDGKFVQFRRKIDTPWGDKLGPPKVLNDKSVEITDLIGNGSSVTLKVEVYDTKKGPGHRIDTVRVDKLVKYEAKAAEEEAPKASAPKKGLPF